MYLEWICDKSYILFHVQCCILLDAFLLQWLWVTEFTSFFYLLTIILMILLCFIFQELFEKLFSPYGSKNDRSFIYLRTFHRVRVTFDNEEKAREAKKDLHGQLFLGYELGVFFVQVITKLLLLLLLFFFTCLWLLSFFREGAAIISWLV